MARTRKMRRIRKGKRKTFKSFFSSIFKSCKACGKK